MQGQPYLHKLPVLRARKGGQMQQQEEIRLVAEELATSFQRAMMLLKACRVPQGEIDHLQSTLDRYYQAKKAVNKASAL